MEKENKYYGIIENLVKKHKKFPGLESILEDIIDDVYSHSEVIIKTVTNEDVINAYLEKVVSTSIITVPKKMNFHPEIKHKSFIREHNTIKVDQKLIDKMINAPEIIKPIEPVTEEVKQEEISVEEEHPQIIQEPITDGSVNIDTIELDMQPEPYKTQEVASLDFEQAETEEAEETVTTNLSSDVQNIDNSIDLGNFTETIPDDLSINFADDNNDINELADEPISLDTEEISEAPLAIEEPEPFKSDEDIEPAEIILPETLEAEQNEVLDLSEDASIEEFNEGLEVEAPEEDITESSTDFTDLVENTENEEDLASFDFSNEIEETNDEENHTELENLDQNSELTASSDIQDDITEMLTTDENSDDLEVFGTSQEELDLQEEEEELNPVISDSADLIDSENLNEDFALNPVEDELEEFMPEASGELDLLQDGDISSLEEFEPEPLFEPEELTEVSPDKPQTFATTDYSKFDFTPENNDPDNTIDIELVTKDLQELANKNPDLNILEIYNMKYKENAQIAEIATKLDLSENKVIEALNEIIAVI
ncbi:TPA: hypothetical protein CPT96_03630 [Candidatus Gastranaerophilales bacterium HUM_10]|nr:MAG TPA: hypothetical protein CPT96_03630 [Candidatus Gastranaerophilales bacterium HUM_10]